MEKVNKKIKELKSKLKFSKVNQVLRDPEVISHQNILQEQYVMCPIDKAANNITLICNKYYVQVVLQELGLLTTTSNTSKWIILQHQNNTLDSVSILKNNDKEFDCVPCMYWLPNCIKYHLVQDL